MKKEIKRILIDERNIPTGLDVLTRIRSFSEIRNGIFSSLERLKVLYPEASIFYSHHNSIFAHAFVSRHPECALHNNESIDLVVDPTHLSPWEMLSNISQNITDDLELFKEAKKWTSKFKVKIEGFSVVGKRKHLFIHPTSVVYPNVVFDTTNGPIIIDKGVKITPFSFLEGPLYIAPNSMIDNLKIGGGSIVGSTCRLGGEIENSIIDNFSNKHHEGFLGHSCIGSWVNMGALSTTSDLKNNYGYVKIKVKDLSITTNTIKFGSIIGDFTKVGIGVMLNTGTVLDIGCNIVDSKISGYMPAFSWLNADNKYRLDYFLENTKKIMARRDQQLSVEQELLIRNIYEM